MGFSIEDVASIEGTGEEAVWVLKPGLDNFVRLCAEHQLVEERLKARREQIRELQADFDASEEALLALQSVGQQVAEVLKDEGEHYIVRSAMGPRYLVCGKPGLPFLPIGTRIAIDMTTLTIMRALPLEVDVSVHSMIFDETKDERVGYDSIGGLKDQLQSLKECIELPLTNPGLFKRLGIKTPKGALLYGPPGTGKTLLAKAMASNMNVKFLKVVASGIIDKYIGESARVVRDMFAYARQHAPCIVFLDEIDAIGGKRFSQGTSADREIQRTLMELLNQLDGFDALTDVKLIMATNRPDVLDPALLRPGRLDRKIEIPLPDERGRVDILKIHASKIATEGPLDFEHVAKICDGFNGADLRNVCTEAGLGAIRDNRFSVIEQDLFKAARKILQGKKLESTLDYGQV